METSTLTASPAESAQGEAPDSVDAPVVDNAQPVKPVGKSKAQKAQTAKALIEKVEKDPFYKYSNDELDVLEETNFGEDAPKTKTKPSDKSEVEEISEPAETVEEDEAPEEVEAEDTKEEAEADEEPDSNPELEALMKEVGAKSPKELLAKVKELRSALGGKDAQAVATLKKEHDQHLKSQSLLFTDAKAGNPEAIKFFEETFGLTVVPKGQAQTQGQAKPQTQAMNRINPDLFIDSESAEQVNGVIEALENRIAQIESVGKEFQTEKQNIQRTAAQESARNAVVDEMVEVAQGIESIKGIPGLREAISAWYGGKADPRIEAFTEIFNLAKENGTNLKAAYLMKRGRESDRLIAEAKQAGVKEAYNRKPNPSLSGVQGGKGESYQTLSDQQIEEMASDYRKIPADWYDKDDNLIPSKIPKNARKAFGF